MTCYKRTSALCAAEAPVSILHVPYAWKRFSDYIFVQFLYPWVLKNELGDYFVRSWKYNEYKVHPPLSCTKLSSLAKCIIVSK